MGTSKAKVATAKLNSFGKEVLARLVGDNNEVLAQKITRKSMSAVNGQIASLNAQLVDAELEVDNAKERLADAKYPASYPSNNQAYCQAVVDASNRLEDAQDKVDAFKESIEFFEGLLAEHTDGTDA